jgi:hypothetical protein
MAAPAPSQIATVLDKHLTTVVNCLLNVVYVGTLVYFLEIGMFWIWLAAKNVSPVESVKGFAYNLWFGSLVSCMMLAFKGTLEYLILFENSKRNKEGKKETTTTIAVDKAGAQIKHVDNGSTNTTWQTLAGFVLHRFMNKAEMNEAETAQDATPSSTAEDDIKQDAAPSSTAEDDIKQDATSASSSARSTADTSDAST